MASQFGSRVSDLPSPTATCRVCGVSITSGPLCEVCSVTEGGRPRRRAPKNDMADALSFALVNGNALLARGMSNDDIIVRGREVSIPRQSAPAPQKPKKKIDQTPKRRRIRLDDE